MLFLNFDLFVNIVHHILVHRYAKKKFHDVVDIDY